jgi:ATP-dependent Lon protease
MKEQTPPRSALPLVALRNMVLFPGVVTGLRIGRPRSVAALQKAVEGDRRLVVVAQRRVETEHPGPADLYEVGVCCAVQGEPEVAPNGIRTANVVGVQRCRIVRFAFQQPYLAVETEPLLDVESDVDHALRRRVETLFGASDEGRALLMMLRSMREPPPLDFAIAYVLDLPLTDKQRLLAEPDATNRYRMLIPVLEVEGRIAEAGARIRREVEQSFTEEDRARYLRQREQDVKRELQELTGEKVETDELRRRIAEAGLPPEALQEAERELARLDHMPPGTPEQGVATDFLEWLCDLPWQKSTEAAMDLARAREVLDRDHYDRVEVKDRILEYLSVRKLKPEREGALLCFVGAPGVGKTSMGRSIADATGRRFHRVSLGGVRDEAEIRGHRRTYIGALPGRIIRAMRTVGVNNPVMLLDEVDKLRVGFEGDPAAALLEVLDSEHNDAFVDNYISVPFDLSRVMFICTANTMDTIPEALLDRLEVIELPGYTTEEKVAIARGYLVPKQVRASGLENGMVEFGDDALELLVERYTREAGVRNLERQIASVCRKLVREQGGSAGVYQPVDAERVVDLLGPPEFDSERIEREPKPGLCPTLVVSGSGAQMMLVEVLRVEGSGKLLVTGRVGEVLRESATLAFTFWKAHAAEYGLDGGKLVSWDLHVHFPAAAQPKEGTSAGLPIALALGSLLAGRALPEDTAAMGEITLRGRVLPVERMVERLAAAGRAGIRRVVVPERNRRDVQAVREPAVLAALEVSYVGSIEEAFDLALPGVRARAPSRTATAGSATE